MRFTKMHGLGNDYVYVNCFEEKIKAPARVAKTVSDRHFGIGSDGLILISPSDKADFKMNIYNADGSEGAEALAARGAVPVRTLRSLDDLQPVQMQF